MLYCGATLILLLVKFQQAQSFFLSKPFCRFHPLQSSIATIQDKIGQIDATFSAPDVRNTENGPISDPACITAAEKIQRVWVPVPSNVSPSGTAAISFIHWPASGPSKARLPLLLIHGFDSSCLEFRRIGPKLAELGIDTYAVDLLGWGFSQLNSKNDALDTKISSYSAQAKLDALAGFWKAVGGGRPFCIGGASLGGAAAIEISTMNDLVQGLILIDAQGFVDGVGPMATLPRPIASLGVQVLKSYPLRNVANQMSYFDKAQFATDDALRIGRLHCTREGWEEALLSFMMSGGFSPSSKIPQVKVPTLIVWGRDDVILEKDCPEKFLDLIPGSQLQWIENCGHVPHLEKSDETAQVIASFLSSKVAKEEMSTIDTKSTEAIISVVWGIGAGAAIFGTLTDSGIISIPVF